MSTFQFFPFGGDHIEQSISQNYLSYLQGGKDIDIDQAIAEDADTFARTMAYVIKKGGYHRDNLVKCLVKLINKPLTEGSDDSEARLYRDVAWMMIQMPELPFSHLMSVVDVLADNNKLNSRRIRMAISHRIANTKREDLIRAYFISPDRFRRMFSEMYLIRDKCDNRDITNKNYKLAYEMSQTSTDKFASKHKITCAKLAKYGVPLHMVMSRVGTPKEAMELAETVSSEDFFRHARWFRNAMGDSAFEEMGEQIANKAKDPMSFLAIKEHLEETGALSKKLTAKLENRAEEMMTEMMEKYEVENLALILDVSSSMDAAVDITKKLYSGFGKSKTGISDMVAFNTRAWVVSRRELDGLRCSDMTSIGAGIVKLNERIKNRKGGASPQGIILISDMGENCRPYLDDSLKLLEEYGSPPLVILSVGGHRFQRDLGYPHAYIDVEEFHPRLLKDIMERIIRLTSKVAIKDKVTTEVVKERNIESEDLGSVELPIRPEETLKPGYMRSILCS